MRLFPRSRANASSGSFRTRGYRLDRNLCVGVYGHENGRRNSAYPKHRDARAKQKGKLMSVSYTHRRRDGEQQQRKGEIYDCGNSAVVLPYDPARKTVADPAIEAAHIPPRRRRERAGSLRRQA